MMGKPRDRTGEIKTIGRLEIERGDFCDAFEQDESRLFSSRECWYCKHGDFGILTECPTKTGVCSYTEGINGIFDSSTKRCAFDPTVQADTKEEEETK
ncbi:hypothetical protein U6B65_02455 [Oscillospiraceae bacterium MB08-C2-2]|nr:hypothetical protein U6B65_02455 [Oscillospiraceae bacterium MB08-C2-2]